MCFGICVLVVVLVVALQKEGSSNMIENIWYFISFPTRIIKPSSHRVFSCSTLAIEKLVQGVKPVEVNIKSIRKTSNDAVLVPLLLTLNRLHILF